MPHPAPGFAFDLSGSGSMAGPRRTGPVVRTLLAGSFGADGCDRPMIAGMLAEQGCGCLHRLVPGCLDDDHVSLTEATLAADGADLVLLDLDGPVDAVLALAGRLRAAASESVAFIGIMPRDASEISALYLSAVMDAVVDEPLRAASLHRTVADALQSVPAGPGSMPEEAERSRMRH